VRRWWSLVCCSVCSSRRGCAQYDDSDFPFKQHDSVTDQWYGRQHQEPSCSESSRITVFLDSTRRMDRRCESVPATSSASEMTYIVSSGALNSTHSPTATSLRSLSHSKNNWRRFSLLQISPNHNQSSGCDGHHQRLLRRVNFNWKSLVGVCTDGAPAMLGSRSGFVTLVKQNNLAVESTHGLIHKEALASRTLPSRELQANSGDCHQGRQLCQEFRSEHSVVPPALWRHGSRPQDVTLSYSGEVAVEGKHVAASAGIVWWGCSLPSGQREGWASGGIWGRIFPCAAVLPVRHFQCVERAQQEAAVRQEHRFCGETGAMEKSSGEKKLPIILRPERMHGRHGEWSAWCSRRGHQTARRRAGGRIQAIFSRDRQWDQREQDHQRPILQGGGRRTRSMAGRVPWFEEWRLRSERRLPECGTGEEFWIQVQGTYPLLAANTLCGCWSNSPLHTCVRLGFRPGCTSKQSHGTSWTWRRICAVRSRWPPQTLKGSSAKNSARRHTKMMTVVFCLEM